jgi:hypothetical protein
VCAVLSAGSWLVLAVICSTALVEGWDLAGAPMGWRQEAAIIVRCTGHPRSEWRAEGGRGLAVPGSGGLLAARPCLRRR